MYGQRLESEGRTAQVVNWSWARGRAHPQLPPRCGHDLTPTTGTHQRDFAKLGLLYAVVLTIQGHDALGPLHLPQAKPQRYENGDGDDDNRDNDSCRYLGMVLADGIRRWSACIEVLRIQS